MLLIDQASDQVCVRIEIKLLLGVIVDGCHGRLAQNNKSFCSSTSISWSSCHVSNINRLAGAKTTLSCSGSHGANDNTFCSSWQHVSHLCVRRVTLPNWTSAGLPQVALQKWKRYGSFLVKFQQQSYPGWALLCQQCML